VLGDREAVPAPQVVAAWLSLGLVDVRRLPWWAAEWLAEGLDGEALRTLAGLSADDPPAIHHVLVEALAEAGLPATLSDVQAAGIAFMDLALRWEANRLSEVGVIRAVEQILAKVTYNADVIELPLGQLYGLDDEWDGGWGRTQSELGSIVQRACRDQLGVPPQPMA
jgi:hypothetical protein